MAARVFYVGTNEEVLHHAQPLTTQFDVHPIEPDKVSVVAGKDDLAIFFSEHFERFRTAITELKAKGCRTLYAIDGILEWRNSFENRNSEPACPWTMRPVLCDKVAAIGRSQARLLDFWGNKNKVELVGLPRLDSLLSPSTGRAKTTGNSGEASTTHTRPRIMVMTAKWPSFTDEQQAKLEESLLCLKQWFATQSQIDVIWRVTRGLDKKLSLVNSFETADQQELVDQLKSCDALITTPSTAMLEGMLLNKPTAVLEFNNCPQVNSVAWQIRHSSQVDDVVAELLNPSPFKLAQQDFALHDTLECESPSLPRLTSLVEQMLHFPAGQAPSNLVPLECSDRTSDLGSEFLFNGHRLTESNDELEIKSQLAFMQREVERLRARNELIEKEFEKAKSTIDHVFNNPVVFPFIKAGELAGRIFSRQPTQSPRK